MAHLDSRVNYFCRVLDYGFLLLSCLVSFSGYELVDSVVFRLKNGVLILIAILTLQPNVTLLH